MSENREKHLRATLTPIVNDAMKRAQVRAQMPDLPDSRQFVDAIVRVVDETSAAAREDDLRRALAKVRAHTGLPPAPTPELMRGMLASIERIADAALAATPPAPDAVPNEPPSVLIAMLDNIEDELRDCTAGLEREPTLRNDLIAIADRLNHVVTTLDMKPAAPREPAIAAPTGETEASMTGGEVAASRVAFKHNLRRLREERGLTSGDVNTRCGWSVAGGHFEFLESGSKEATHLDILKLRHALSCSFDALLAARVPAPVRPVEGSAVAKLRELAGMVNGPLAPALGDVVLDNRVAEMYVGLANEILSAVETLVAPSAPQEPRGEPSEGMRDEALAALERAHAVVSELCDGSRKWIMSIPARPDHDPDLIIGKGIRLARRALSTGGRDA